MHLNGLQQREKSGEDTLKGVVTRAPDPLLDPTNDNKTELVVKRALKKFGDNCTNR